MKRLDNTKPCTSIVNKLAITIFFAITEVASKHTEWSCATVVARRRSSRRRAHAAGTVPPARRLSSCRGEWWSLEGSTNLVLRPRCSRTRGLSVFVTAAVLNGLPEK